MNQSFWGVLVVMLGIAALLLIVFFQSVTNTDEHNSQLLKEITEAAMWDAFDYSTYRKTGEIRINREKFVENFTRRYAESASKSREYTIQFYDINEKPPKVSLKVTSSVTGNPGSALSATEEPVTVTINNKIDAILEVPY